MPEKKKRDPNELSDRDLLREVFPERVAKRIEEELNPYRADDNDPNPQLKQG